MQLLSPVGNWEGMPFSRAGRPSLLLRASSPPRLPPLLTKDLLCTTFFSSLKVLLLHLGPLPSLIPFSHYSLAAPFSSHHLPFLSLPLSLFLLHSPPTLNSSSHPLLSPSERSLTGTSLCWMPSITQTGLVYGVEPSISHKD